MSRPRPGSRGWMLMSEGVFALIVILLTFTATVGSIHFKHTHPRKQNRLTRLSHARCIVVVTEDLCGGSRYSVRLAEMLRRRGVPMTFAVPAWEAYAYPDRMRKLRELGGDLINHANDGGASYAFLGRPGKVAGLPVKTQRQIIHTTQKWIHRATGVRPDAFRAPGLAIDENTYRALVEEGIWVDSSKIYTRPGTRGGAQVDRDRRPPDPRGTHSVLRGVAVRARAAGGAGVPVLVRRRPVRASQDSDRSPPRRRWRT
ncbi:polysaccharide deacetylase family protein [Methanopyrus kandleri]|uniref:Predicted xylanase/chitin deacetylase family enzyme n=1 Tax=Methanopyrus kandleri (strain AV19 / DSM 6324 / JCM 9639 / NBRC 100938) TaxID=190192 RepID=Q8TVR8_METKA|nr:polysaccharide deacetylase family protein [Methanopyrus kandleri]AAM02533.1 Predicted xylanase/chitin deacetylase family enzyme [Methanopyrus kandleri AV19]